MVFGKKLEISFTKKWGSFIGILLWNGIIKERNMIKLFYILMSMIVLMNCNKAEEINLFLSSKPQIVNKEICQYNCDYLFDNDLNGESFYRSRPEIKIIMDIDLKIKDPKVTLFLWMQSYLGEVYQPKVKIYRIEENKRSLIAEGNAQSIDKGKYKIPFALKKARERLELEIISQTGQWIGVYEIGLYGLEDTKSK